jgi:hypothetical protein
MRLKSVQRNTTPFFPCAPSTHILHNRHIFKKKTISHDSHEIKEVYYLLLDRVKKKLIFNKILFSFVLPKFWKILHIHTDWIRKFSNRNEYGIIIIRLYTKHIINWRALYYLSLGLVFNVFLKINFPHSI